MKVSDLVAKLQTLCVDHPEVCASEVVSYSYDMNGNKLMTPNNETVLVPIDGLESIELSGQNNTKVNLLVLINSGLAKQEDAPKNDSVQ